MKYGWFGPADWPFGLVETTALVDTIDNKGEEINVCSKSYSVEDPLNGQLSLLKVVFSS